MGIATISSKNQVTLPADIRAMLSLAPGDKVFFSAEYGKAILRPLQKTDFLSVAESLAPFFKGQKADVRKSRSEAVARRLARLKKG